MAGQGGCGRRQSDRRARRASCACSVSREVVGAMTRRRRRATPEHEDALVGARFDCQLSPSASGTHLRTEAAHSRHVGWSDSWDPWERSGTGSGEVQIPSEGLSEGAHLGEGPVEVGVRAIGAVEAAAAHRGAQRRCGASGEGGRAGGSAEATNFERTRYVVVRSDERKARDDRRRGELLLRTEDKLVALEERVRTKRLTDPAKIGVAADRILRDSGVGRCFTTTIREGYFAWDFTAAALDYEERLLAGRYVITTSLDTDAASTADVVRHYKMLANVERRYLVMKDFLGLRPVHHRTEHRVRAHIALCVIAAVIEA